MENRFFSSWSIVSSDESLWKKLLQNDFAIMDLHTDAKSVSLAPKSRKQSKDVYTSYKKAYCAFFVEWRFYKNEFAIVYSTWRNIENWLEKNGGQHILATLQDGISAEEINKCTFIRNKCTQLCFRLRNGQTSTSSRANYLTCGLLGGYNFYEYV